MLYFKINKLGIQIDSLKTYENRQLVDKQS